MTSQRIVSAAAQPTRAANSGLAAQASPTVARRRGRPRKEETHAAPTPPASSQTGSGAGEFGPRSVPLFYTALCEAPKLLALRCKKESVGFYRASLAWEDERRDLPLLATSQEEWAAWSFDGIPLQPGILYHWELTPIAPMYRWEEEALAPSLPQGRFWVAPNAHQQRLDRGREIMKQGSDPDFVAVGLALLMCELELYQDALHQIRRGPGRRDDAGRSCLAQATQALLYQQMSKRLMQAQTDGHAPPEAFLRWANYRERLYRTRAQASRPVAAG